MDETRSVQPPATRLESGAPVRLWYGVAGAPLAWVLASAIAWLAESRACVGGTAAWGAVSPWGVRLLLLGLWAAAFAAGLAAMIGARRAWRELSPRTSPAEAYGYGTAEYIAIAGSAISFAFLLAIFWSALPAVVVGICQEAR